MAIKNIQCEDIPKVPKSQKVIVIAPDLQAVLAFLFIDDRRSYNSLFSFLLLPVCR